jgi:hypothetical protein
MTKTITNMKEHDTFYRELTDDEYKKIREDIESGKYDYSIRVLSLPVRAINQLLKAQICSIKPLLKIKNRVGLIKHIGETTNKKIQEEIKKLSINESLYSQKKTILDYRFDIK